MSFYVPFIFFAIGYATCMIAMRKMIREITLKEKHIKRLIDKQNEGH